MKYYQIDLDVEVTGVKNGIRQIDIELSKLEKDNRYNEFFRVFSTRNSDFWKSQKIIKHIEVPTILAKLLKKANITDLIGYTPNIPYLLRLVYSKKLIDILKVFNTGGFTTFEVSIENVIEKYYLLFLEAIGLEEINYKESLIYSGINISNAEVEYSNIENYNEYRDFIKQAPIHEFEKVSIPKNNLEKDVIRIQGLGNPFYSEKLIDFLLDCNITGLSVKYNNSPKIDFY